MITLGDIDRIVVRQDRSGRDMLAFSVQLEVLISGNWHRTMRFDSSHGRPHRHLFYPDGTEHKEFMTTASNRYAFTESVAFAKAAFERINDQYKRYMDRMV